ncbi:phospholipase B1, membrane-associated [Bombina bombina]|uniref:phospholipase B1, membrane-associated n=1 Tax=Bombina bombina TaxID=8345 RepID=UPI00235A7D74|nr:phospholipase B1, membrane-associated [Bombina bombina]
MMKAETRINFNEDWKLVTLFIGGNDLCDICDDLDYHSPDNFVARIQEALDILHNEVPRVFVNLVSVLDIIPLKDLYDDTRTKCPQFLMRMLCSCVVNYPHNSTEINTLSFVNRQYQEKTRQLVESGRYDTREDFTVVIQPFLETLEIPKTVDGVPDRTFMAPDCFHFSERSHAQAARGLWKNMLEPVGQKTVSQKLDEVIPITCPPQGDPFVKTAKNSISYSYPKITHDPRSLIPCNFYRNDKTATTSVHSLNPFDIRVVSSLGSLKLTSSKASNPDPFQSIEELLLSASQFTVTKMAEKLFSSVNSVSLSPQQYLEDEAKKLVESLQQSSTISFADDWKMILIFITAEDACDFCNQESHSESTIQKLSRVLDYLHQQLPKTIVSLVDLTDLSVFYLSHPGQSEIRKSCECFRKPSDYNKAILSLSFQGALERLISSGRYDTRDDFTVVLRPVLKIVDSDSQQRNMNNAEDYHLLCSDQESVFLNTHKNSPYSWLSNMLDSGVKSTVSRAIGSNFTCVDTSPSATIPTSVHKLKPADFKVIGALGDSLTAANGAGAFITDVLDVVTEYRGLSWSIGGDQDLSNVTTLPNILRMYNPNLEGYSTRKGSQHLKNSYFNRAVPGAKADDMPEQAQKLVDMMKKEPKVNFTEDWKLVTLFIGGNDLCGICNNPVYHSPERFVGRIREALDIFHNEVPRLFVNLVTILNILPLKGLYDDTRTHCPETIMRALCGCVVEHPLNSSQIQTLELFNKQYQEKTHQLIGSGRYDTREDFTVVIQPFLEILEIPINEDGIPDRSFMAPDCFHFGEKAHAQGARGLWKNMLEPVGQKTDNQKLDENISIHCPAQSDPFVKTAKNSNYTYPTITPDTVHGSKLLCADKAPSPAIPTSVHALRPADITVVAAVGDSLTAGNGIASKPQDVLDVFTEYRGMSWSIGGDSTLDRVTTLPNILLEFNPHLTGYSTGKGNSAGHASFLNEAVPGAKAFNLPDQVRALIDQMNGDKRINFLNDWKVITVFIGANDLCASCTDSNFFSSVSFITHIKEALDLLHAEVPRAFVNLVEVMDIIPLRDATMDSRVNCPTLITKMLCPCLLNIPEDSNEMQMIKDANKAYQESIEHLIDSGRYDTREDFTVVLQPFFRTPKIPFLEDGRPDISYLAPDCFHLSQKSHSQLARMLWKNMLQPVGHKADVLDFVDNITLSCPTQEQPYFRTYKNSNYKYPEQPNPEPPVTNWGSDLSCAGAGPSSSIPTSAHKLRPADIKVVAALGDSLTAAFGANASGLLDLSKEWRGISWSIGGDGTLETHTTLPNILKKFNPNIKGYSIGIGKENAMFNVAVGGAKAENMPSQARTLVDKMKQSSVINFNEDWKLITLFIGGNDLCQYCQNRDRYSLSNHIKHIETALDIFYNEIPRVFVNLVEVMEVEGLRDVTSESIGCSILKPNLCPCFITPRHNSPELNEVKKFNRDLQAHVAALSEKQKYQGREDFAVVAQPFFRNTIVPVDSKGKVDVSFFSSDCFHFHERGHAEMAIALWNNMLEPVGQKQDFNEFVHSRTKLKCPLNDRQYLFTQKNSRAPIEEPTPDKDNDNGSQVPYWSVIIASVGGVALGCAVVGIAMSLISRKRARKGSKLTGSSL